MSDRRVDEIRWGGRPTRMDRERATVGRRVSAAVAPDGIGRVVV
jgi:hypothetical protein